jgi:hypothetical protein
MNYQYTDQSSTIYNCHTELLNSPILVPYEDTLFPQLVPPLDQDEDTLIPSLVPPSPHRILYTSPPSRNVSHFLRNHLPEIEIIEEPVEVFVTIPAEIPEQQHQQQHQQHQQPQAQVPQHVINGYIESVIQKKELCPILMTELTLTTTSMTPCGHCISKDALITWFQTIHACPVCRLPCLENQLQGWKL